MIVIGIHNTGIQSAAAVAVDGEISFAVMEERLDRRKYSKYFPRLGLESCLAHVGAKLSDVDCFAIGWNPGINIGARYRAGFSEWPAYAGERLYSNPNHILPMLGDPPLRATDQIFHWESGGRTTFTYTNHHLAHIALSYYPSGFDHAAILISDGYGERATTVWAEARGGEIRILRSYDFPQSLGSFYSSVTEHLGYRPDCDEWKVMGASALGDPGNYMSAMQRLLRMTDDGGFRLDLDYFDHFNFDTAGMFSRRVDEILGMPRRRDEPLTQRHYDIAAAAQRRLEDVLSASVKWLKDQTEAPDLCLGGGVMMNSVFNGRVTLEGPFCNVFVPFAPDDSGNALGAALWASGRHGGSSVNLRRPLSPCLGKSYGNAEIIDILKRYGLNFREVADPAVEAADLLMAGKVVGWFQGRMEFGQRALGSRSIIADPRRADMKDRINAAVKYREAFRPFAPAVLAENVAEYFDCPATARAPFMEKVFPVRAEKRAAIPAVVHADGSGRLQTVSRDDHPEFHALISEFYRRSGVPVVLNTSFNLNGEPIVEHPTDAVRTFFSSGMDALVIGNAVLTKRQTAGGA